MDGVGKPVIPFVSLPDPCPGATKYNDFDIILLRSSPLASVNAAALVHDL